MPHEKKKITKKIVLIEGSKIISQFKLPKGNTMCPRGSDLFYIVTYHINWVATSWTNYKLDLSASLYPLCVLFLLFRHPFLYVPGTFKINNKLMEDKL